MTNWYEVLARQLEEARAEIIAPKYRRKPARLEPKRDPSIPHPGRTWYQGRWRTPEQLERARAYQCAWARKQRARGYVPPMYDRTVPHPGRVWYSARWMTPEQVIGQRARSRYHGRKKLGWFDEGGMA